MPISRESLIFCDTLLKAKYDYFRKAQGPPDVIKALENAIREVKHELQSTENQLFKKKSHQSP